jgi:hypothetical protein
MNILEKLEYDVLNNDCNIIIAEEHLFIVTDGGNGKNRIPR